MKYTDESNGLRIELDTKGCEMSPDEIAKLEEDLHTLRQVVEDFPVADLTVLVIHHARSDDYHVKTSLALPGKRLFTGDRDVLVHPAYERCLRKLVKKVQAYKERMNEHAEWSKEAGGTHHTVLPNQEIDVAALEAAAANDDYRAFRCAVDPFQGAMTERVGRWVQRYQEIEAMLGETVTVSDIVEDVFLNAFEQFVSRSADVPLGHWLEGLIDPTVQDLIQSPDEEFAKISFARATLEP
jgi:ribosome-associated translation inhibitor RaiA